MAEGQLAALEARVREDLAFLNYAPENWVPETQAEAPVSDVVIVGGGMCGLVAWFALQRAGVRNIRIVDRAARGLEGPWLTYARMETLRSPKQLLGPAYGIPSLTFQAWYRAQFGDDKWDALYRIPRPMWMDYLIWYRKVLGVPVENGVDVDRVAPRDDGLMALKLKSGDEILARHVVMATGRDGMGGPFIPGFVKGVERHRLWAHSADPIDFDRLKGKKVLVIGVGASAVDNAAESLEHGAAEVRLLARRPKMPTINKLMGIGSYGVTAGFPDLTPEWRWKLMQYSHAQQTPAPHGSTLRVSRHENAYFHFNCAIASVVEHAGGVRVTTTSGRVFDADFLILGTGFRIDPTMRPELADYADRIACWEDFYTPPADLADAGLARFPWLAGDFSFVEKTKGAAPWLSKIHSFNYSSAISLGKVSGDIPAISEGALWLARGLASDLFRADIERHWLDLMAYEKPELDGTEWRDADAPAPAGAHV